MNARYYLMCRHPNLHELARKFYASFLRKFLDCVSPPLHSGNLTFFPVTDFYEFYTDVSLFLPFRYVSISTLNWI